MAVATRKKKSREELIAEAQSQGYRYVHGSLFAPLRDTTGKKFRPLADWQIESHCLRAKKKWKGYLSVEEGERPKNYQGYVQHFMNFVTALWPKFEWNPNAVRMANEIFVEGRQFIAIAGHKSCVAGDTRILNPVTGESPTIQSLCEANEAPVVMTLNGPTLAGVPFLKGRETLYEFELSNGSKFKCTARHRVLTPTGWMHAYEASVGSDLFGYSLSPLDSTSALDPSVHGLDALHCSERAVDFQSGCRPSDHLYDGPLLREEDASQDAFPSPADARPRSEYASWRKDDLGKESEHSHACPQSFPSTGDGLFQTSEGTSWSLRSESGISSPPEVLFQRPCRCDSWTSHPQQASSPARHFSHKQSTGLPSGPLPESELRDCSKCAQSSSGASPSDPPQDGCFSASGKAQESAGSSQHFCSTSYLKVEHCRVLAIRKLGEENFYDLEVPEGHHYFAEGAIHHNSGKSEALAYFSVAFYLIDPRNTMVIATSKTLQAAKLKIWGVITRAWNQASEVIGEKLMPGILTTKHIEFFDGKTRDPLRGIELLAGEQSQIKKSAEKLQGIKAPNIFVAADELATLSPGLVETAVSNLTSNENLKFVGSFNPASFYDASRLVAMPKKGWGSINIDSLEWETELGYCIRFDGLFSPNLDYEVPRWTGLYTREMLKLDIQRYHGEKTAAFYQMVRAFWPPDGAKDAIYSSQEIETYRGEWRAGKGFVWMEVSKKLCGLDPSYRAGGDRAVAYFGQCGLAKFDDGRLQVVFQLDDYVILAEDVTKAEDKPRQVAESLKKECELRGVPIEMVGIDVTGAAAFASVVRLVWGDGFLEIRFSEKASEVSIAETHSTNASEDYYDRLSELWYCGKPLLRSEQFKGIGPDVANEMVNRSYSLAAGKTMVEPKDVMKKRIGRSPDISDAAFCCLDVARQRCDLTSSEKVAKGSKQDDKDDMDAFTEWANSHQLTHRPNLIYDTP